MFVRLTIGHGHGESKVFITTNMTSPIEKLVTDIETLETERDTIYKRFEEIRVQLENYKTLLVAFKLVSTDPDLYDKWVATVNATEKPKLPEPVVSN